MCLISMSRISMRMFNSKKCPKCASNDVRTPPWPKVEFGSCCNPFRSPKVSTLKQIVLRIRALRDGPVVAQAAPGADAPGDAADDAEEDAADDAEDDAAAEDEAAHEEDHD